MTIQKKIYAVDIKDRCFDFSIALISLLKEVEKTKINNVLVDQLARSGTSIGANVIESQASSTRKELIRYYRIALKSNYESIYWLKILHFFLKEKENDFNALIDEADQIKRILTSIILKLEEAPK